MATYKNTPAELRGIFGANLRKLSRQYPSISELARQLGINRTQFNRYLSGESFPRPDVLARICNFFEVDARVLLEPVDDIPSGSGALTGRVLSSYLGAALNVDEAMFPSGFFRFSRRSFVDKSRFATAVIRIWREKDGNTFVRGFEAREAIRQQGLAMTAGVREFRGIVMRMETGISLMISRKVGMTSSFNYLTQVPSFENNFWAGYVTRTIPENPGTQRATRLVYEYLGPRVQDALPAARASGLVEGDVIPSFHLRLLQPDVAFA